MRLIAPTLLLAIPMSAYAIEGIHGPDNTAPSYSWPTSTKIEPSKRNFLPDEAISYSVVVTGDKGIGITQQPGEHGDTYKDIGGFIGTRALNGDVLQESFRITRNNASAPITGYYWTNDTRNRIRFEYAFAKTASVPSGYKPTKLSSREYIYAKYDGERYFTRNQDSESDTVVITRNPAFPAVVAIKKNGSSGKSEAHLMSGPNKYTAFQTQIATVLNKTGYDNRWVFDGADYNNDGVRDLFAINKQGAGGTVDVHILDGKTSYKTFILQNSTVQHSAGSDSSWNFAMGDYNKDGHLDLYAIKKNGASGKTEVHILNGAASFQNYLLHKATPLGSTGVDNSWIFEVGDYDGDGIDDVYAIEKNRASTAIHILDGASSFGAYSLRKTVPFGNMGSDQRWVADVADYNADGYADVFFIDREGAANKTAVHILDGKQDYQAFLLQTKSILGGTGMDGSWDFVISQ